MINITNKTKQVTYFLKLKVNSYLKIDKFYFILFQIIIK